MVMQSVIKVNLKLAIPLRIVVDKLGLHIDLVVYPMDQLIATGCDDDAL